MNKICTIDVSYLRPSKTLETVLLENKDKKRILYVYNFDGIHFRVFNHIIDIISFFDNKFDSEIEFESEDELDRYLINLDLTKIPSASPILSN